MALIMRIKAYILRRLTRKKSINFDIQKAINILFLRYDRIGDMVITTPVFRELKLAYPEINITVLASKANQYVLLNNPYVDRVITNHKNNLLKDLPTLLALRKEKFDVCVEFDHSVIPHSIIRLKIIKSKKIISIYKDGRYGVNGNELSLYDIYTEKKIKEHFRDIWLGVLEPFGIKPKSRDYDLFVTDEQNKKAKNYLKQFPSKFLVGINLEGAVKGKKIEPSELFQICHGLYDQNKNIQIIILSAPDNYKNAITKVKQMGLNYVEVGYKTDRILDVAALINHLDLIITPDTSIVHIASAFNKPLVTIHENNQDSFDLFAPISRLNRTVFSKSKSSIQDFSVSLLLQYCDELISLKIGEQYE
jgi:ADP-heptose:LPS heptosyltransferase